MIPRSNIRSNSIHNYFIFDMFDMALEYLRETSSHLIHFQSISRYISVFQRVALKCYFNVSRFILEPIYLSSINRMCNNKMFLKISIGKPLKTTARHVKVPRLCLEALCLVCQNLTWKLRNFCLLQIIIFSLMWFWSLTFIHCQ